MLKIKAFSKLSWLLKVYWSMAEIFLKNTHNLRLLLRAYKFSQGWRVLFLQTEKLLLTFIALFQLTETGTASE